MTIVLYFIFIIGGLLIGSFLNVCIDRLPNGKSIVLPPSHCDSCGHRLLAGDLIPLFSFIRFRGKCRYCGEPIPQRVIWVEFASGAMFGLLFWNYGLTADFGIMVLYSCVLLILFVIDLEHKLILNVIVYPMMVISLIISSFQPGGPGVVHALIGGAIGFLIFFIISIVSRGGMGFGDVKMAGLIGLALGYPKIFAALLLAVIAGGIVAIILLAFRLKRRKEGIPFGPFLALGAMAAFIWGDILLKWYLKLISIN
jgi:leader peptidase (prepilin peptidase) / N-methyltransferase